MPSSAKFKVAGIAVSSYTIEMVAPPSDKSIPLERLCLVSVSLITIPSLLIAGVFKKQSSPKLDVFSPSVIVAKEVHPEKQRSPRVTTESGIVNSVNPVQLIKQAIGNSSTLPLNSTLVSNGQLLNQPLASSFVSMSPSTTTFVK